VSLTCGYHSFARLAVERKVVKKGTAGTCHSNSHRSS